MYIYIYIYICVCVCVCIHVYIYRGSGGFSGYPRRDGIDKDQLQRAHGGGASAAWPLHDIAITNIAWCTAYKRGVEGLVYCAIVVQ